MDQKELGELGETMAHNHLIRIGYEILDTNWKFGRLEIDIVAKHGSEIVFVEVKTRENDYVGPPWKAVNLKKQKKIIKAANQYLIENDIENESRFDIVSIIVNSKYQTLEHICDAFYPML